MNALNRIGGVLLVAGLAIAVILGFQTPTGRRFWDGVWQAGSTVVGYAGDQIQRLNGSPVSGNPTVAVGIAAVSLALVIIVLPKPISGRLFTVLVILATVLAFVLYEPSVLSGVGG